MIKGYKKIVILTLSCMSMLLLSGCEVGRTKEQYGDITDNTVDGEVTTQTSTLGIKQSDINKALKDGEDLLTSGQFYVVHKTEDMVDKKGKVIPGEEIYYPAYRYITNFNNSENQTDLEEHANPNRMLFFTIENDINIPTLFLDSDDKLVYYCKDTLLDYMKWERYRDLKYTIGVYNLKPMTNGRYYINVDKDSDNILSDSELFDIYNFGVEQVLLDKIGGTQITEQMVDNGVLVGALKNKKYDLEIYTGTKFAHYLTTANIRAFAGMELFASVEYETKQEYLYEIKVPEYFVNGYYMINDTGLIRIVRGTSYHESETEFNERLLYPRLDTKEQKLYEELGEEYKFEYQAAGMYSEYEPLNKFSTNIKGKLGYVEENIVKTEEESQPEEEITFTEAKTTKVDLFFPKDVIAKVTIVSPSHETTGDCFITIGKSVYKLQYDGLLGEYQAQIKGKDEYGILTISGFFHDCELKLEGCKQESKPVEYQETDETEETEIPES